VRIVKIANVNYSWLWNGIFCPILVELTLNIVQISVSKVSQHKESDIEVKTKREMAFHPNQSFH